LNYKLIYRSYGNARRGADLISNIYSRQDHRLSCYNIDNIDNIESLRDDNSILVFKTQIIKLYNKKYNFIKQHPTDVVYIRHEENPKLFNNPVNNGFSYSKNIFHGAENKKFINNLKYMSPKLYNFKIDQKIESEHKVIGFYSRPTVTSDSSRWFIDFLDNLQEKVELYTMGTELSYIEHKNVIKCTHTFNNKEFFSHVTHYIYFKSNIFQDPYPHNLMEAVQTGCQIIVPYNYRLYEDGIEDILSCIDYHTNLNNEIIDNSGSVLNLDFSKYMKELVDRGFKHTAIKELDNFKNFKEWIIEKIQ